MDSIIDFFNACGAENNKEKVKNMIEKNEIDPSIKNNYSIFIASYYGNLEIVKILISDDRVDPSDNNNSPVRAAYYKNYFDVVNVLIRDKRVNQCDNRYSDLLELYNVELELLDITSIDGDDKLDVDSIFL